MCHYFMIHFYLYLHKKKKKKTQLQQLFIATQVAASLSSHDVGEVGLQAAGEVVVEIEPLHGIMFLPK